MVIQPRGLVSIGSEVAEHEAQKKLVHELGSPFITSDLENSK